MCVEMEERGGEEETGETKGLVGNGRHSYRIYEGLILFLLLVKHPTSDVTG